MENEKSISAATVLTFTGIATVLVAALVQQHYSSSISLSVLGMLMFTASHIISRKTKIENKFSRSINLLAFVVFVINIGIFMGIGGVTNGKTVEGNSKQAAQTCVSKLKLGTIWSDTYEEGSKYIPIAPTYYFYMRGKLTPSDNGQTATGYVFGKAWYVFWTRWGNVEVNLNSTISCEGQCEGEAKQCFAGISTTGNSSRQVSIVRGLFDVASAVSGNEVTMVAVFSGSLSADGGPSIEVGKEPLKLSVSWPNANAENTFQAGTYKWRCECH